MQKYVKKEKRYRLINFICLLAVYKKLIGTGRVLGTRILRYVRNKPTIKISEEKIMYQMCCYNVVLPSAMYNLFKRSDVQCIEGMAVVHAHVLELII